MPQTILKKIADELVASGGRVAWGVVRRFGRMRIRSEPRPAYVICYGFLVALSSSRW